MSYDVIHCVLLGCAYTSGLVRDELSVTYFLYFHISRQCSTAVDAAANNMHGTCMGFALFLHGRSQEIAGDESLPLAIQERREGNGIERKRNRRGTWEGRERRTLSPPCRFSGYAHPPSGAPLPMWGHYKWTMSTHIPCLSFKTVRFRATDTAYTYGEVMSQ